MSWQKICRGCIYNTKNFKSQLGQERREKTCVSIWPLVSSSLSCDNAGDERQGTFSTEGGRLHSCDLPTSRCCNPSAYITSVAAPSSDTILGRPAPSLFILSSLPVFMETQSSLYVQSFRATTPAHSLPLCTSHQLGKQLHCQHVSSHTRIWGFLGTTASSRLSACLNYKTRKLRQPPSCIGRKTGNCFSGAHRWCFICTLFDEGSLLPRYLVTGPLKMNTKTKADEVKTYRRCFMWPTSGVFLAVLLRHSLFQLLYSAIR